MGSSHGSDWARGTRAARPCGFAAALGRRCRVAHNSTGPTSVSIALWKQKKELPLGQRTSEVTRRVVRRRSLDGPAPHVSMWHEDAPQWRAPLGSSTDTRGTVQTRKLCKKPLSQFIIAPRAQGSRRCETQATLGGKPPSCATVSVP